MMNVAEHPVDHCLVVSAEESLSAEDALVTGDAPNVKAPVSFGQLETRGVWTCVGAHELTQATLAGLGPAKIVSVEIDPQLTLPQVVVVAVRGPSAEEQAARLLDAVAQSGATVVVAAFATRFEDIRARCANYGAGLAYYPGADDVATSELLRRFVNARFDDVDLVLADPTTQADGIASFTPLCRVDTTLKKKKKKKSVTISTNTPNVVSPTTTLLEEEEEWLRDLRSRSVVDEQKNDRAADEDAVQSSSASSEQPPRTPQTQVAGGEEPSADSGQVRSFFENLMAGNAVPLSPPPP